MSNLILKKVKLIKNLIFCLMVMAFVTGCYTLNKSHNAKHNRALKKDMQLMHEDIDFFLGTAEASTLSER